MWTCPKCGRTFKRQEQSHFCGKAPETVADYIEAQLEGGQQYLSERSGCFFIKRMDKILLLGISLEVLMSIINELNEIYRIDASNGASDENEIEDLIKFSSISIPTEYLELIQEVTEAEICIRDKKYIRIWGANGCIEMNKAYSIQRYISHSLAIGDDEDGNAILYAKGKNGFGIYAVAFNDLGVDEMVFLSKTLREILISANGVEELLSL